MNGYSLNGYSQPNFYYALALFLYCGCTDGLASELSLNTAYRISDVRTDGATGQSFGRTTKKATDDEPQPLRFYAGMWSHHLIPKGDVRNKHDLVGVAYRGHYFGTFINSLGQQTWSLGIQKSLIKQQWDRAFIDFGYRLGVLYGYSHLRMMGTPFFPAAQLILDADYQRFGVEFSYAVAVVTCGFYYRI